MARQASYTSFAPFYDALSFEWPVYRAGRVVGVSQLRLRPGDRVLDVGCGTGLSFALLHAAVGPQGRIVGLDASGQMLEQARQRGRRKGWANVVVRRDDAMRPDAATLRDLLGRSGEGAGAADAVLFTYSLSLMEDWPAAWSAALKLARPGARIAVVDMALPVGAARVFGPLARLACAAGGSDISAHPWSAVERDLEDVSVHSLRGGHLQVRAGTVPRAAG